MSTTTQDISSVLNNLIETLKDGQNGFREAAEDVKNPDYKALFADLSIQRQQFVTELQSVVHGLGEHAERTGSVAAALHRGWIDLKSAISSGDEHSVLAECERGEDVAVAEFRSALEHPEIPENIRTIIAQQAAAVQNAHDRVKALRDASK